MKVFCLATCANTCLNPWPGPSVWRCVRCSCTQHYLPDLTVPACGQVFLPATRACPTCDTCKRHKKYHPARTCELFRHTWSGFVPRYESMSSSNCSVTAPKYLAGFSCATTGVGGLCLYFSYLNVAQEKLVSTLVIGKETKLRVNKLQLKKRFQPLTSLVSHHLKATPSKLLLVRPFSLGPLNV